MGVLAAVALATAFFSETAGQSENRVPIDTTICELRTSPQRFDGEMVQFKANYRVPFIDGPAVFFDSCPAETPRIRIELAEWTERLENDPELREALTQCHVINAAFLGRFDVVPKQNEETKFVFTPMRVSDLVVTPQVVDCPIFKKQRKWWRLWF
jgi:hypothetical protein